MTNFNEDALREAAYYIWKNNGCQANNSTNDWNDAINQLSACAALSGARKKPAAAKTAADMAKVAVAAVAKKSSAASAKKMPQIILSSK